MIDDIVALKSSLTATVNFIKQEAAQAHELGAREISQFSTELKKAREFIGHTQTRIPGWRLMLPSVRVVRASGATTVARRRKRGRLGRHA